MKNLRRNRRHHRLPTRRRAATERRRLVAQHLEDRRLLAVGPYSPAAGEPGSTAVAMDDPALVGWATAAADYAPGEAVASQWQDTSEALGPAEGTSADIVSLGRGGELTLTFDAPIRDGIGADFAVFENSFNDTNLELAFVEVSSDGTNFVRFPSDSLTPEPVGLGGSVDPTGVDGLAGKYRQGFGTPFDLEQLAGVSPRLDTTAVTHVRLVDVIGDGSASDTGGDVIYDPYPTAESAGFDVEAVGVLHQIEYAETTVGFEDVGASLSAESAWNGPDPQGQEVTGPYDDTAVLGDFESGGLRFNNVYSRDFDTWNQWAYSNHTDTTTAGFTNQFSAYTGGGADSSSTFGVGNFDVVGFYDPPTIALAEDDPRRFGSIQVTNTTYPALSMLQGDSFAKQFGGETGDDPDWFLLTIEGKDAAGASVGTVDFYLADYRFADNSRDYIVDTWTEVDLSPLNEARSLEFSLSSSDTGDFGMNTPAYFAADELVMRQPVVPLDLAATAVSESDGTSATTARVSRAGGDASEPLVVNLASSDAALAEVPPSVTIPAGESFTEFDVAVPDDDRFVGDRQVTLHASAEGMVDAEVALSIAEDDERALSVSVADAAVSEAAGDSATTLTVTRNDADVSSPLDVNLASDVPAMATLPNSVTIPAGSQSVVVPVAVIDDDVVEGDQQVNFTATAAGYVQDQAALSVEDEDRLALSIEAPAEPVSEAAAPPTATLETLGKRLPPESFNNGSDGAGGFVSSGVEFNNSYNESFGAWSGWSYSNTTDTTTAGFGNQYSAITGGGAAGSDTYAVAAAYSGSPAPTLTLGPDRSAEFQSLAITNTTYAALSMRDGDQIAKKFGGESGDDPDWFRLTIEGFDAEEQSVGTVDFYLADYRFQDNSRDYIVDRWTTVDVSSLSGATQLAFSLSSSDVGDYGMNTPAYFAVDNVVLTGDEPAPAVTVTRNSADVSRPLDVTLASNDPTEARLPRQVTIPAGASSVEVPLAVQDDVVVDGAQSVEFSASASDYVPATLELSVEDDDVAGLLVTETGEATAVGEAELQDRIEVALAAAPLTDVVVTLTPSAAEDLAVDAPRLVFTPENWDQPQTVLITGAPDLVLEPDEEVQLEVAVDASASDPAFAAVSASQVTVTVEESVPGKLYLAEQDGSLTLYDDATGTPYREAALENGLHVVTGDRAEAITVHPLSDSAGAIEVEMAGGDDWVEVLGDRFDRLDGGGGYDELSLASYTPGDLAAFLADRATGFEKLVFVADAALPIRLDAAALRSAVGEDAVLGIEVPGGSPLQFEGDWILETPRFIESRFTRIVRAGELTLNMVAGAPWQNVVQQADVNNSGQVTALDVLLVINRLSRSDDTALAAPTPGEPFGGVYLDVSGDDRATALDALRVINHLSRAEGRSAAAEGERSIATSAAGGASHAAAEAGANRWAAGSTLDSPDPGVRLPAAGGSNTAPDVATKTSAAESHERAIRELFGAGPGDASSEADAWGAAVAADRIETLSASPTVMAASQVDASLGERR